MIGTVINGYKILREIGKGGMATVYYGENSLGKKAAIKVLNDELSKRRNLLHRFKKEADIMLALDKKEGICQVYDRTESEGRYIIVMEYLEGMTMNQYIKEKGPIRDGDVLRRLCKQVLTSLEEAHHMGIVHRDIKPSNLFYTIDGKVKLLDFGISKVIMDADKEEDTDMTEEDSTSTRQKMGTLAYMSPEQIKCTGDVDQRTDVYSFGITLYYLMTGKDPLLMEDDSLTEIDDILFQQAIRHATRKDRDKRTPDCSTFLKEINAFPKREEPVTKTVNDSKRVELHENKAPRSTGKSNVRPVRKQDTSGLNRVLRILLILLVVEIIVIGYCGYTYDNENNRYYSLWRKSSDNEKELEVLRKKKDAVLKGDKDVWQVRNKSK